MPPIRPLLAYLFDRMTGCVLSLRLERALSRENGKITERYGPVYKYKVYALQKGDKAARLLYAFYGGLILMSAFSTLWNWMIVDEHGKRQKTQVYK